MDKHRIEPPMNPNAEEDFKKAIEEFERWQPTVIAPNEQKNRAVLAWRVNGAWQDFVGILLTNGYDVEIKHLADGDLYSVEEIEVIWGDRLKRRQNNG